MSAVKQSYAVITIDGREYEIAMTLSVIDQLQDRYGSLQAALTATQKADGFVEVMRCMINDNIDYHNEVHPDDPWKPVSKPALSRKITARNFHVMQAALFEAFDLSLPAADQTQGNR